MEANNARDKNVVISTPTASGKSLCYLLPVIDSLIKSANSSTALLVFPLKALAQDQYAKIKAFLRGFDLPEDLVGVYDADATADQKRKIRATCKIIITNPYGLHQYLQNLRLWREFFKNIKYIIFDEVHVYNGVFGSNIAFVMRRLERAANAFGKNPQWILCSATIGNPKELATKLVGLEFHLVDNDGSARSAKRIWFWNPMYIDRIDQQLSYHQETRDLFKELVLAGFQTLLFTQSRKMAELQAKWALDTFKNSPFERKVMAYRAGYPPKTRRAIEQRIRDRELFGISTTSALELGIDIGTLDSVIISGFPGSMTSFWQQAGRCGRGAESSLVVFCAGSDALDQYYINNQEMFFKEKHEDAIIGLENKYIVEGHLECAIKEIPLHEDDAYFFGPLAGTVLNKLSGEKKIHKIGPRYFHTKNDFPAERVSLSTIPSESYKVFDVTTGKKVYLTSETENRVFSTLHDGAIFLFMTETYRVEHLDLDEKEVILRKEDVDYYTQTRFTTSIMPIGFGETGEVSRLQASDTKPVQVMSRGSALEPFSLYFGDVRVESEYSSYVERKISTTEILNSNSLNLPATSFLTKAMWFDIPLDVQVALDVKGKRSLAGGLHAIEHGAIGLFPRHVLCSRWDIGGVSIDLDPVYNKPMVYIYDGFPGGIGLAEKAKDNLVPLLKETRELVERCRCKADTGCPSCIQSPKCGNGNEPLSKNAARSILSMIIDNMPAKSP